MYMIEFSLHRISTIKNPNVSEEAKASAEERLEAMDEPFTAKNKDPGHVVAGLKA